jgi:hypothetical protein
VTEAEWLEAQSPENLLLWLGAKRRRRRSMRKNGLFVVACAERVMPFMTRDVLVRGVELSARMAEGTADEAECDAFLDEFRVACTPGVPGPQEVARVIPHHSVYVTLPHRTGQSSEKQAVIAARSCVGVYHAANDGPRAVQEASAQAALLREVVGNPFRPVAFSPEWRTDIAVVLAQQMYESREFSAMPILADALQDAGCDSPEVLDHCRDAGRVHVRGCWVVDLVLGKE